MVSCKSKGNASCWAFLQWFSVLWCLFLRYHIFFQVNYRFLKGSSWRTLRIPREDWGTLGKIRGITTPPLRILLLKGLVWCTFLQTKDVFVCEVLSFVALSPNFTGVTSWKEDPLRNTGESPKTLWVKHHCCTLPKPNIAPEKFPKPKREKGWSSSFHHGVFRGDNFFLGGMYYHIVLRVLPSLSSWCFLALFTQFFVGEEVSEV